MGYPADPEMIYEQYGKLVDIVVNGGYGNMMGSTVIDCSRGEDDIEVLREGLGGLEVL